MPYSIVRDEKLDVTRISFKGTLDRDELLAGLRDARATPGHSYRTLVVVTPEAVVDLAAADIRVIASALRSERDGGAPRGRSAVVARSDLVFGLGRMIQAYWDESPSDLRVFHDEEEGLAWLTA